MKPMTSCLGVGVVGLGVMGGAYIRAIRDLPYARLMGVADLNVDRLNEITRQEGVPGFRDYQELFDLDGLEAVIICTPETVHVDPAQAAAQRGLHLLIEKPLATTTTQAEQIIAAARQAKVKLMAAHILRFDPRYAVARDAIARGEVGDMIHMYTRRSGLVAEGRYFGGRASLALCFGVHDFDILRWYSGAEVQRVYAEGARQVLGDLGVDDTVMCVLKLSNGAVATVELSWVLPDQRSPTTFDVVLELVGTRGVIKLDLQRQGIEVFTPDGAHFPETSFSLEVGGRQFGILKHQLEHFLDCVINDRLPLVAAEDARESIRIAEAVDQSLREERPVTLSSARGNS